MKNYKQAFTLVELTVVITILSVLSTVGFVAFSDYLEGVRDASRVAQLKNIHDGILTYQTQNTIPTPDDYVEVQRGDGTVVGYQGYVGESILSKIEFSAEGLDPKDKVNFTYATSANKRYFALMGFLEEEAEEEEVALLSTSHAVSYSSRYPYVTGKKIGIIIDDTNTPIQENTIIAEQGYIDITDVGTDTFQIYLTNDESYVVTGTEGMNRLTNYDCKRLQDMKGGLQDGIYGIDPDGDGVTIDVYCDMTTDGGGWTITTMLADTTTENLFSESNTDVFITDIESDIATQGRLSSVWTDTHNRDIMLQCFSDEEDHVNYEDPFVIYDFLGDEKENLTDDAKSGKDFSSEYLIAKWKNNDFVLNNLYYAGATNDMLLLDSAGLVVFGLLDDQLTTENSMSSFGINSYSPANDTAARSTSLSATTYCISAIR